MCDYSLEMYQSRPALAGETYQTHRFSSGSVGFVAPSARDVAVCMASDTMLKLEHIPAALQQSLGVGETERATFTRLELGPHHDGLRFGNGVEVSLQRLGPGVAATLIDTLQGDLLAKRRPRADVAEFAA